MAKVIYDFGMNNGDDVSYYLTKSDKVVAVEANKKLCDFAADRFSHEVAEGRLTILNVALSGTESLEPLPFYIHKDQHVLSQILPPSPEQSELFDAVLVQRRTGSSIVRDYGTAHYIKIDIEHYDHVILRELFVSHIFPDHISAESHSAEIFCLLGAFGYNSFNLVDGQSVPEVYGFPPHSAGPFGEDLLSPWYDLNSFFSVLASAGMGWKDVHASKLIEPNITVPPSLTMAPKEHMRDLVPSLRRRWKQARRRNQLKS
jgi:FkbM family methyltransferase